MAKNNKNTAIFPIGIILFISILMGGCVTYSQPLLIEKTDDKKFLISGMPCYDATGKKCNFTIIDNYICTADSAGDLDCKNISNAFSAKSE